MTAKDLKYINILIDDGMGYMLQTLFLEKAKNKNYERYYGNKKYYKPISVSELEMLSNKCKNGEISINDVCNSYELKTINYDEFIENNSERKSRIHDEKSEINNNIIAKSKTHNKLTTYKSK